MVSMPVCAKKERNGLASTDKSFYSQPSQPLCAQHVVTMPNPHTSYIIISVQSNGNCMVTKNYLFVADCIVLIKNNVLPLIKPCLIVICDDMVTDATYLCLVMAQCI